MQDSIGIVLTVSGILGPLAFQTFDLQCGNIGSPIFCWFVTIWSWCIWLCTYFVEVLIGWKTVVLFSVRWWVETRFAFVQEGPRPVSASVDIFFPQLSILIAKPTFV